MVDNNCGWLKVLNSKNGACRFHDRRFLLYPIANNCYLYENRLTYG